MSAYSFVPQDREEIFRTARDKVLEESGTLTGQCLSFAWHGLQSIKSRPNAPRTIIQAGSASWPRIPKELDDGNAMTHLSYVFDPETFASAYFFCDLLGISPRSDPIMSVIPLPEIHVWLAIPETKEIIDFTTGTWPQACQELLGEAWIASPPPEYLWVTPEDFPDDVRYMPNRLAITLVVDLLRSTGCVYP